MSSHLLTAAIAHLRAQYTPQQVAEVRAYGGEFNAAEVGQLSYACPAVLVTVLGWKPGTGATRLAGRNTRLVRMAAFCAFKDMRRDERLAGAMALADSVALALRLWVPCVEDQPVHLGPLEEEATCENLYSRAMDERGQGLWLVTWDQAVKPLVPLAQLYDWVRLDITDTTRQGVVPATATEGAAPTVTEEIDFADLPAPT